MKVESGHFQMQF